ncbi:hypothetical protein [Pseudomonas sp. NFACC37-1]|uniref:hypothetical protein n=1 Tax=Pseudomonas sp. NFACC37-1 TaxID=1566196 RepID=UPI0008921F36|nr:hypothetical protein [Pseudomonas sp. NFACC37-1]SCY64675.1 hypothetical protein SAMN03159391_02503 [Pseudomonas sp. NFACC37-1]
MFNVGRFVPLGLALALAGCMPNTPYRTLRDLPPDANGVINKDRPRVIPAPVLSPSRECGGSLEEKRCVQFVEFDEFGNPESRNQLDEALTAAEAVARCGGLVTVYVHGWHHSAAPDDSDIKNFKTLVFDSAGGKPGLGIYVAWRGDSINSDSVLGMVPSYLGTFWDRKSTAHNIGNGGGVTELLRSLSDIRTGHQTSRFLVIGHSFGGAIVYSSLSDGIAENLRRDAQDSKDYSPIADLVVLINPAFEAMRLRPLYGYARNYQYPVTQPQRLIIVTSEADSATGFWFKVGRRLGTLTQAYPEGSYVEQDSTAVGHYDPYITHKLTAVKSCPSPDQLLGPAGSSGRPQSMCIEDENNKLLLTRCDQNGKCDLDGVQHYLNLGKPGSNIPHNFPIYNIRTTKDVIPSHVSIWKPPMKLVLESLLVKVQDPSSMPIVSSGCAAPASAGAP